MQIDGGCFCRYITFEAEIDAETIGVCHCTDCQILSGSPYRVVVLTTSGGFRLLSGTPTIYVRTAASGTKRAQAFCPKCGTPVWGSALENPQIYNLRVGTIRQRASLQPRRQLWCVSEIEWAKDLSPITERFDRQPNVGTRVTSADSGGDPKMR
jgi:hypothetical protein